MIISTYAKIIIAIISVALAGYIFFGLLPKYSQEAQCKSLVNNLLPGQEIPENCKKYISDLKVVELDYKNEEQLEEALAEYIISCWIRSERGSIKRDIYCYEIKFKDTNLELDPENVRGIIKKYSDLDPSYVEFYKDYIYTGSSVLVVYRAKEGKIVVW